MKLFPIKSKKLWITLLSVYVLIILTLIVPIPKYALDLPGNISLIASEIEIDGLKSNNEFYSIYVVSFKRPTAFQILIGNLSKKVDVYKDISPTTSKEDFNRGVILEELSYQYALINAYTKAKEVDPSITINYNLNSYVITYSRNDKLEIGDQFSHVDGRSIVDFTNNELSEYFKNNEQVTLRLLKDEQTKEVTITKTDGLFGIIYDKYYEITNSNPTYKTFYEDDNKVGPSGGLLQTLEIYAILTGKKFNKVISGTGTIDANGKVGAIGGVKQKIFTANNKVDIFFCPEENYADALKAYKSIKKPTFKLVKVSDFNEAIEELLK